MLSDRVRLARKRSGLSLRGLADCMGNIVSAQAISKYEAGEAIPSSGVLVALAKALNVSIDFLMSEQEIELADLSFRRKSGTSAQDRSRVEAEVLSSVEKYLLIEDILHLNSAGHALARRGKVSVASLDEAEEQAKRLRAEWKLGDDPIPSMTHLLEDKGFKVLAVALPEKVFGLTCGVKRPGRTDVTAIVVNRLATVERWRFSLAHELAHHVIGEVLGDVKIEKAVDRFAASFLMPRKHLKGETGAQRTALAYQELMRLKQFYGVSAAAFIYRLGNIGVLPEGAVVYAFQSYARPWRSQEPEPLDVRGETGRGERPERFERLVYRAVSEGLISLPKAAGLLSRSIQEIELAVRGPRSALG